MRHLRDKRGSDSVKKSWRKVVDRDQRDHDRSSGIPILFPPMLPHKPEDSGYLSTDSNESKRRLSLGQSLNGHHKGQSQGSLSETDESLCDGASESGGESVATDSFFFGSFRGGPAPGAGSLADRRRSERSGGGGGSSRRSSVVLVSQ